MTPAKKLVVKEAVNDSSWNMCGYPIGRQRVFVTLFRSTFFLFHFLFLPFPSVPFVVPQFHNILSLVFIYLNNVRTHAYDLYCFSVFAIHAHIFVYKRLVFSLSARRQRRLMGGEDAYPVSSFLTTSCGTASRLIPETKLEHGMTSKER